MCASHGLKPLLVSMEQMATANCRHADTDLIYFRDAYFCVFHEGQENGLIRVLISTNGVTWKHAATIEEEGWSLSAPKLSVMPDGRLHLIVRGVRSGVKEEKSSFFTAISEDGNLFSPLVPFSLNIDTLSCLTWHQGIGYGCAYSNGLKLITTTNGIDFDLLGPISVHREAKEGTLLFLPDDHLVALVYLGGKNSWIGSSFPPFIDWLWASTALSIGNCRLISPPLGESLACGIHMSATPYGHFSKAALYSMDLHRLEPILLLPGISAGSIGLIYQNHYILVSYSISSNDSSSIIIAKLHFN